MESGRNIDIDHPDSGDDGDNDNGNKNNRNVGEEDNSNESSDYVTNLSISFGRGTSYIRKQNVRAKAYSELYYASTKNWGHLYYFFHFSIIGIGLMGTLTSLIMKIAGYSEDAIVVVAGIAGVLTTGFGTVNTIVNPGKEMKIAENAGDSYSSLAEDLELFDPYTISGPELNDLVKSTAKRVKKLKREFPEPDQEDLRCKKAEIVDRIRAAKESLLYLTVDPSAVGGDAEIQRSITTIHNIHAPTNTPAINTPRGRRVEPETTAARQSSQSIHRRNGGNSSAESSDSDTATTVTTTAATTAALAEMMEEGTIPPGGTVRSSLNNDPHVGSRRSSTVGRRSYIPQRRGTLQDLQDGYGV